MAAPARLWSGNFILVSCAHLLMTVAFYCTMPVFALFFEERLGITGPLLGLAVASSVISAVIIRPLAGFWLDRFGRRVVYLPAFFLFGALFCLYPATTGALFAVALRFSHGIAWGSSISGSFTTAVDFIPPERRGEGIGYFSLFMVFSMACGPALGMFIKKVAGFDTLFFVATGIALAGWFAATRLRFPSIDLQRRPLTFGSAFERSSIPLGLVMFFLCLPYGGLMNFSALYASQQLHARPEMFFICFALGTAFSRALSGKVYDRRGPRAVLMVSFFLLFCGLAVLAEGQTPLLFYAAALVQGSGDGMGVPVLMAMVNDLVPANRRGAANGTLMTFLELGIGCGILLTGALYEWLSWRVVFWGFAGTIAIAAALCLWVALPHYAAKRAQMRREDGAL